MMLRIPGPVLALALLAGAGCSGGVNERDGRSAQVLAGRWRATFTLDGAAGQPGDARPRTVAADVVLLENRWMRGAAGLSVAPADYGAFSADFSPFGFDPRVAGRVPEIAVALVTRDSAELAFQPDGDAAGLTAAGHLAGDSIAGRWWHASGRGAAASGTFRMTRRPGRE
jgi:hypothetical protein